jgi:ketosteroid isomerase-like protein
MTTESPALQVARAYFRAWTSGDIEAAMSHIASDIVLDTPGGRLDGADAFRQFLEPFSQILKGSEMLAAFGDEDTALIMYDTQTVPVPSAPGAEHIKVADGKIVYDRFIFDRLPFTQARD